MCFCVIRDKSYSSTHIQANWINCEPYVVTPVESINLTSSLAPPPSPASNAIGSEPQSCPLIGWNALLWFWGTGRSTLVYLGFSGLYGE